jgi:hypothetical protein
MKVRLLRSIPIVAACLAGVLCMAASVPAWLDDAISNWNTAHPETQIRFVDIKDSFVWYDMPKTTEVGQKQIRERVNNIVLGNGYEPLDDEELVTTGRPPVTMGRSAEKKCWSRSFVLNVSAQSDTKAIGGESSGQRQRMLTSLVCEDSAAWWAAFRVAG